MVKVIATRALRFSIIEPKTLAVLEFASLVPSDKPQDIPQKFVDTDYFEACEKSGWVTLYRPQAFAAAAPPSLAGFSNDDLLHELESRDPLGRKFILALTDEEILSEYERRDLGAPGRINGSPHEVLQALEDANLARQDGLSPEERAKQTKAAADAAEAALKMEAAAASAKATADANSTTAAKAKAASSK